MYSLVKRKTSEIPPWRYAVSGGEKARNHFTTVHQRQLESQCEEELVSLSRTLTAFAPLELEQQSVTVKKASRHGPVTPTRKNKIDERLSRNRYQVNVIVSFRPYCHVGYVRGDSYLLCATCSVVSANMDYAGLRTRALTDLSAREHYPRHNLTCIQQVHSERYHSPVWVFPTVLRQR